jgi:nucleotidyltransferase/DNA polymerase involved in DNA repair
VSLDEAYMDVTAYLRSLVEDSGSCEAACAAIREGAVDRFSPHTLSKLGVLPPSASLAELVSWGMRARILGTTQLTSSCGIACTRMLSMICSGVFV